jgi:predicted transglutaminase-like cysteine proteinase
MHKRLWAVLLIGASLFAGSGREAAAGLLGSPLGLRATIERIRFSEATLAPMAFTMFCMRYAGECDASRRMIFRGGATRMTRERMAELIQVNATVNRGIVPTPNERGLAGEEWLIGPSHGDCNDYAVTKRHELIARGWPMRNLLLSEVVTSWGEHHLVLVVRAAGGDLVLDSLFAQIRSWSRTPYRWVRMQTPKDPNHWASIAPIGV